MSEVETFNGPWSVHILDIPGAWEINKVTIAGSAGSDGDHDFPGAGGEAMFDVDGPEWTLQIGVFLALGGDPHWIWSELARTARFDAQEGLIVGVGQQPHPSTAPVRPMVELHSLDPAINPPPPGPPIDFTVPEGWIVR